MNKMDECLTIKWIKEIIGLWYKEPQVTFSSPPFIPSLSVSSACTASSVMRPGWRLAGRTWGTSKRRWGVFCTQTPSTRQWGTGPMGTQEWPLPLLMVQWRREEMTPRRWDVIAHSSAGALKWSKGWVEVACDTVTGTLHVFFIDKNHLLPLQLLLIHYTTI